MTEKELFVSEIQSLLDTNQLQLSEASLAYFESMKMAKAQITKKGQEILDWLSEHDVGKPLSAKEIAEGMNLTSRSVSGSLRALVTGGYVSKDGKDPVKYSLINKDLM